MKSGGSTGVVRAVLALAVLGVAPWLAVSPARAAFSAPITISPTGQDAILPQVAVDDAGDALIVWQVAGPPGRILARSRSAAGVLGAILTLSAAGDNAVDPQVAIDADGDALVIWGRLNFFGVPEIQARPVSKTGTLGSIVTLSGTNARDARVAVDSEGDAVVVWRANLGTLVSRIQARARSRTGVLAPTETLSPAEASSFNPAVVIDADGDALVVWEHDFADGDRIQALARSKAGVLGPIQTLSEAGRPALSPHVALDADGDAFVVWQRQVPPLDTFTFRIQGRARTKGGALRPIQNLSSSSGGASEAQVAIDADGDALVLLCHKMRVWQQGHRGSCRARERAILARTVAMEFGTWRSGRIGGAAGLVIFG